MNSCCVSICSNDNLLEEEPQAKAVADAKSMAVAAATAAAQAALRPRLEPPAGSAPVADGGVLALHCHLQHVKTHQQRQVGLNLSFGSQPCSFGTVIATGFLENLPC